MLPLLIVANYWQRKIECGIYAFCLNGGGAVHKARWHKTHLHILFPGSKESVWIDGNINITSFEIFKKWENFTAQMMIPVHGERDCIYDECRAVSIADDIKWEVNCACENILLEPNSKELVEVLQQVVIRFNRSN